MIFERVERRFGRRKYLDIEPLVERTGTKFRFGETRVDVVVIAIGALGSQALVDAE